MVERRVRLFLNEELDENFVPASSSFVMSVSGGSIVVDTGVKSVFIHNREEQYTSYQDWIDLDIRYEKSLDISDLQITYSPQGEDKSFRDKANVANVMEKFSVYRKLPEYEYRPALLIRDAAPKIDKIYVSADGSHMGIVTSPQINTRNLDMGSYGIQILVNSVNCDDRTGESWSVDFRQMNLRSTSLGEKQESYTIKFVRKDGGKIQDVMGQEYDFIEQEVINVIDSTVSLEKAELDLAEKTLKISFRAEQRASGSLDIGCEYQLIIDGKAYLLRGYAERAWIDMDYNEESYVFKEDNLFHVDFSSIKENSVIEISNTEKRGSVLKEASGKLIDGFKVPVTLK